MTNQQKELARLQRTCREIGKPYQAVDGNKTVFYQCSFMRSDETVGTHGSAMIVTHPSGEQTYHCQTCQGKTVADMFASLDVPWHVGPRILQPVNLVEFAKQHTYVRRSIVQGLISEMDVVNIVGTSKAKKSLLVLQLVLCIAGQLPFLGKFATQRLGKILYLDYELHADTVLDRVQQIMTKLGIPGNVREFIDYHTMRGRDYMPLNEVKDWLCAIDKTYSLVVVDALYRAYPEGINENSNSDLTRVYNLLDTTAQVHGCAFVIVHHATKGNQVDKSVTDIGAGGGAQSRAVDAHVVLVDHSEPDTVAMKAALRACEPLAPIALRCNWPIWEIAEDIDPTALAVHPMMTVDDIVARVPSEPVAKTEFITIESAKLKGKISQRVFKALLDRAIEQRMIIEDRPKNPRIKVTICVAPAVREAA